MSVYTDSSVSYSIFDLAVGTAYPEFDDFTYMLKQESTSASFADAYHCSYQDSASAWSSDSSNHTSPSPHQGSPHLTLDHGFACPVPAPFVLPSHESPSFIHDRYINWDPFHSGAGVIGYPEAETSETLLPTSVCPAELTGRVVAALPTRSHYVTPFSPSSDYDADSDEDSEDNGNDEDYEPESDSPPFQTGRHKRARSSKVQLAPEAKRPRTESKKPMKQRGRAVQASRPIDTDDEYEPASSSPSPRPSSLSSTRRRAPAPKRNKVAKGQVLEEIISMLGDSPGAKQKRIDSEFQCPMSHSWTEGKKRMPDFVRHLKTHLPPNGASGKHICPCGEVFSRPDAMRRHQRNSCHDKNRLPL